VPERYIKTIQNMYDNCLTQVRTQNTHWERRGHRTQGPRILIIMDVIDESIEENTP